MKINTPSLGLICKGQIDKIENNYMQLFSRTGECDLKYLAKWAEYKNYLVKSSSLLSKNVKYITEPYFTQVNKQIRTLANVFVEGSCNNNVDLISFKGILFSKDVGCVLEMQGAETFYTLFDKIIGTPIVSGFFMFDADSDLCTRATGYYLSEFEKIIPESETFSTITHIIFSIILQKMVEKKEIIIVPPKGKYKTKHDKYVNENPTAIEVLDSRIFNSYVRLEGFPVEGHFRNQPIGEGRKMKKLIWINEFEKAGYNYKQLKNLPN